ncbi:MAG: GGDEF domain-containing protein [Candidatus Omnitrophica bacterium]|nr:GGDEF domain-containing protein [Candidatus Omnitrophota bacterium]
MGGAQLRSAFIRLTARRYRRILIASFVTLAISVVLLVSIGLLQWRGHQAIQRDARNSIADLSSQLLSTLKSRRGTVTLLRDTMNRQPQLPAASLKAMGISAVAHTRYLVGIGLLNATDGIAWWSTPPSLSAADAAQLNRLLRARSQNAATWRSPSAFVARARSTRTWLIFLEPLRASSHGSAAVCGVFDVKALADDVFAAQASPDAPAQFLQDQAVLYRSPQWIADGSPAAPMTVEHAFVFAGARWLLQMQPERTPAVRTLSTLTMTAIGLGVMVAAGVIALVWILAARTWVLQRAVLRRTAALRRTSQRLRLMATTDELTGLNNRRFFLDRWELEYARAKRYNRPLACLMIDVNGFKQVNDRLGHAAGDVVLQQVARELRMMLRQSDLLARFGGDEFVVALPETTEPQAAAVAEKLRQISVAVPNGRRRGLSSVTLSVGMARAEADHATAQESLQAADQSLYEWKRRLHTTSRQ